MRHFDLFVTIICTVAEIKSAEKEGYPFQWGQGKGIQAGFFYKPIEFDGFQFLKSCLTVRLKECHV